MGSTMALLQTDQTDRRAFPAPPPGAGHAADVVAAVPSPDARVPRAGVGETAKRRPLRILLLENDPEDAWVVSRFLDRSARFEAMVTRCADAGEARAAVLAASFDLWLFDIYLDQGTSLEFVSCLRQVARGDEAPIVVLTGADTPAVEDLAFERGAMTCLSKADVTTGTLDSAVSAALRGASAERRARSRLAELDARLRRRTAQMGDLAHEVGNLANVSRTASALRGLAGASGVARDASRATGARQPANVPEAAVVTDYDALMAEYVEQLHATTRAMLAHAGLAPASDAVAPHDAGELARRAERLCLPLFADGTRALRVAVPARPAPVALDAVLLMQVVLNLVSNAVKHSPPGGDVDLSVDAGPRDLVVAVTDRGGGIAPAALDRLRRRGRRGRTAAEGHGIGLAVVDDFLARMGGRLEIESTAGAGTTMRAVVPAAPDASAGFDVPPT